MGSGPLRVHPANPRYFTDGGLTAEGEPRAIYLAGAHTWNNLLDMGRDDPPEEFDFVAYLAFLARHNHNFARLWAWDVPIWDTRANDAPEGSPGYLAGLAIRDYIHHVGPMPWARTGPGLALDGRPKFDLETIEPAFLRRLRSRVMSADRHGIYVSVMLFEGWALSYQAAGRASAADWAWRAHPFHPSNNVNGIDASGDAGIGHPHKLANESVNRLQAGYIRAVVDTVNDLDNVLFEVINEGGDRGWDWWVVNTIREFERTRARQHPIGLTGHGAEDIRDLLASPADWISPGGRDGFADDPPAWDGRKVSLLDTDHIWGIGGDVSWVWKSFLRGHNPLFMDPYDGSVLGPADDPRWEPVRNALGDTRRMAERFDLAAMRPRDDLSSTSYCLAGAESLLALQPRPGESFTMDLRAGAYRSEWFDIDTRLTFEGGTLNAEGGRRTFRSPFHGPALLHLYSD